MAFRMTDLGEGWTLFEGEAHLSKGTVTILHEGFGERVTMAAGPTAAMVAALAGEAIDGGTGHAVPSEGAAA